MPLEILWSPSDLKLFQNGDTDRTCLGMFGRGCTRFSVPHHVREEVPKPPQWTSGAAAANRACYQAIPWYSLDCLTMSVADNRRPLAHELFLYNYFDWHWTEFTIILFPFLYANVVWYSYSSLMYSHESNKMATQKAMAKYFGFIRWTSGCWRPCQAALEFNLLKLLTYEKISRPEASGTLPTFYIEGWTTS